LNEGEIGSAIHFKWMRDDHCRVDAFTFVMSCPEPCLGDEGGWRDSGPFGKAGYANVSPAT
jgi:hypothetical protein